MRHRFRFLSDRARGGAQRRSSYALNIFRRDSNCSMRALMPNSREMANDSSSRDIAFWRPPDWQRWRRVSAHSQRLQGS